MDVSVPKPKKARPLRTPLIDDTSAEKLFPNSLRLLIASLRRFWPDVDERSGGQLYENYAKHFEAKFRAVEKKYGKHGYNDDVGGLVDRLGRGDTDISYYHMRSFSETCGVPLGVFLTFSHLVGDSAKGFSKNDLLNFLDSTQSAIEAIKLGILHEDNPDGALRIKSKGKGPYKVRLSLLKLARDAYQRRRIRPNSQLDDLIG